MYFLKAVVLGFATLAAAQSSSLKFTNGPSKVVVGQTYDLTYTAADESSPVTIILKNGPSGNLQDVETLTTSATGGSYSWTVSTYPDGQYALEITQGSENNYWGPFPLTGGSAASSSASSSGSSSATGYTSTTLASNSTMTLTGTAYSASGSGATTMHRNTTLSSATLKTKSTSKSASTTATVTKGGASSSSSQASATTSHPGASSVPTGNAAAGIASPFALLFGVMGALAYLN